jgi:hypothetical protein
VMYSFIHVKENADLASASFLWAKKRPQTPITPIWGFFRDRLFQRAKLAISLYSDGYFSDDTFDLCRSYQN